MKLSTKGRYGLRAIVDLAVNQQQGAVSISSIAARQSLSENYLEQLMSKLKKAGLICSVRGAQGGYVLAKEPEKISVGDILRALEGDLTPVACVAINGVEGNCSSEHTCVTKYVWQRINESIEKTVDEMMIDQLVAESRKAQEKAKNHDVDYSRNSCSG